jgi:integrase
VAHVERRGPRRWRARYRAPNGRELSPTFATRRDAERWLAATETSKARGEWVDPDLARMSVRSWAEHWLELVRPTLKPKTQRSYESLLQSRVLPVLSDVPIGGLRQSDVQSLVATMQRDGLSASRTRQAHRVLSQLLDTAVNDGRVVRNVARGAMLPKIPKEEAPVPRPVHGRAHRGRMPLGVRPVRPPPRSVGLRYGEAAALQRRNVDLLRRRLHVDSSLAEVSGRMYLGSTKAQQARIVPLPPSLADALAEHMQRVAPARDAFVFTAPRGEPLRYPNFYRRVWVPALTAAHVPHVGVHVLRHSAAAALIAAGANAKAVQRILGHSDAGFRLTRYGHLFDTDLDDLAARLDEFSRPHRGLAVLDDRRAASD